jgi:hypothetical protein
MPLFFKENKVTEKETISNHRQSLEVEPDRLWFMNFYILNQGVRDGGACSTHMKDEKYVHFSRKPRKSLVGRI